MPDRKPLKELFFAKEKYNPVCDRTDYAENKIEVLEKGPVRGGLRIQGTLTLGPAIKVDYEQDIFLYADSRRIDFCTKIRPSGKHYRLRVCFASTLRKPEIIHEIPLGQEVRCEGEFPAQNWVNYLESDRGFIVLNRGLAGNNFQNGVAMISLFRSVAMDTEKNTEGCFCEGRAHCFEYAVIPYVHQETINPVEEGQIYNAPAITTWNRGNNSQLVEQSFVEMDAKNVSLSMFRREDKGYLLRLYETQAKSVKGMMSISLPVKLIVETDGLGEHELSVMPVDAGKVRIAFKPFEIRTFRLY
jgi:alpha-mannosidase